MTDRFPAGVQAKGPPCRKVRYPDRITAALALLRAQRGRRNKATEAKRGEARAYRCPSCKGWHLTSRVRRQQR